MYFIVIEGIDRSGKDTQATMLAKRLVRCGSETRMFHFPNYDSITGKIISDHLHDKIVLTTKISGPSSILLKPQASPHDAMVFQCVQTCDKYAMAPEISKALRDGQMVICNRWWQSSCVYGMDDGIDPLWLVTIQACLPRAGLNILLDLDPEKAVERATEPSDRYERDLPKQKRLRESYLSLWREQGKEHGNAYWKVVPASRSAEEVHEQIVSYMKDTLWYLRCPSKML